MEYILIYFAVISLITIIVTVYDKKAAKKWTKHRVPEKILFLLGILGGSLAEYLTMLKIRHKTKHKRFMIGLPIIMVLQVAITICYYYFVWFSIQHVKKGNNFDIATVFIIAVRSTRNFAFCIFNFAFTLVMISIWLILTQGFNF